MFHREGAQNFEDWRGIQRRSGLRRTAVRLLEIRMRLLSAAPILCGLLRVNTESAGCGVRGARLSREHLRRFV